MQFRNCLLAMILLGLTLVSLIPAHASTERRVALVIGNGAYDVSPLRNPVNDAQDMAALLRGVGFEVILKTDADKRGMIEAIEEFDRKLSRAGIGLMYYAGHGMQIRGRNYLIPVRARIASEVDVELESVDVYRVLGRMEAAGTATSIIILDACRDNPFERAFRTTSQGLAQMDAPPGSIIAFATAPGGVAADGEGRNGVYTRHLLQNLARPGIGLTQALMDTRRAVAEETRRQQVPWESTSLMADIFLATTDTATAAPAPPPPPVQPPALPDPSPATADIAPPREVPTVSGPPPPAEPKLGDTWTEPYTGMEFVWVPGGCYWMGSPVLSKLESPRDPWWMLAAKAVVAIVPVGCSGVQSRQRYSPWQTHRSSTGLVEQYYPYETPRHEVCLDGFWMGKYEVTQAQWEKVMGNNPSHFKGPNNPVEMVSWNDTQNYIRNLNSRSTTSGFRLPTEAEWEYACRSGGKEELYCGGNNVDTVAWYSGNSGNKTHPVGGRSPNGLGLYDMSGNVSEWIEDVWDGQGYSKHTRKNPVITSGESRHILRGGSWNLLPMYVRAAYRSRNIDEFRNLTLGFRLALSSSKQNESLVNHTISHDPARSLFESAESFFKVGNYGQAVLACQDIISQHPHSAYYPKAMLMQGMSFIRLKKDRAAVLVLNDLIKSFPDLPESEKARNILRK